MGTVCVSLRFTIDYRPRFVSDYGRMLEREPDYEDPRIRAWTRRTDAQGAEEYGRDPTILSLDMEKEEIYESRTYRLRPSLETLAYLTDLVAGRQREVMLTPREISAAVAELMGGIEFKFLAKRRKEDGLISSKLVAVRGGDRSLLQNHDWVGEGFYRDAVRAFEEGFLPQGVLGQPLVVSLEEWRRYNEEGAAFGEDAKRAPSSRGSEGDVVSKPDENGSRDTWP